MKWTKEKPVEEGHYWLYLPGIPSNIEMVCVVKDRYEKLKGIGYMESPEYEYPSIHNIQYKNACWFGPIEPPMNEECNNVPD